MAETPASNRRDEHFFKDMASPTERFAYVLFCESEEARYKAMKEEALLAALDLAGLDVGPEGIYADGAA